ncbi:MAG: type II secretion system F family protein [Magnetococcales bacterium]|nr:type II secretion system F family protein [Magnetococcales bacterium]
MPIFQYKAIKRDSSETVEGSLEAKDQLAVARQLQETGLIPLKVIIGSYPSTNEGLSLHFKGRDGSLTNKDQAFVAHELSTLLDAGMDVSRAIRLMIDLSENERIRKAMMKVMERIQEGDTLSKAMEKQPEEFLPVFTNMVKAGETGGSIARSLLEFAIFLERSVALQERTKSALVYPIFMLAMMGVSLAVLFGVVLPQFKSLFEDAGNSLPLMTRILLVVSHHFREYGKHGLLFILCLVVGIKIAIRKARFRYYWHGLLLKSFLVGDVVTKFEVARFCRMFGTLLKNGVETMQALSMATKSVGNMVVISALTEVSTQVNKGQLLSNALEEKKIFPPRAIQLLRIGEETGKMSDMLERLSDIYEKEVESGVEQLMALLTPIITIIMGLLVGLIVISILTTVLSVNKLAF